MSPITLARPYARAAFAHACERKLLIALGEQLRLAAQIATRDKVRTLLTDPRLSRTRRTDILLTCGEGLFDTDLQHFLQILGERDRLGLLGEIAEQYEQLRAEHEQRLTAEVVSAQELNEVQRERIRSRLAEQTGQAVEVVSRIDEQLLGGAVVRVGDRVLDGSLRSRLDRLAQNLA